MLEWIESLASFDLFVVALLVLGYFVVGFCCLRSIYSSRSVGWYRGIQNSPLVFLFFLPSFLPFLIFHHAFRGYAFLSSKYSGRTRNCEQSDDGSFKYIGHHKSLKLHRNDFSKCKYSKMISEENKKSFSSREDALRKGYSLCKVCFETST